MIKWNNEITEEYRNNGKSITNPCEIVPGMTIWLSHGSRSAAVVGVFGNSVDWCGGPETPDITSKKWIWFTDGSCQSLHDNNIGASYNPWMIFRTEKDMLEYNEKVFPSTKNNRYDYEYVYYHHNDNV